MRVAFLFYGVALALRLTARFYPVFRARLEERDLTVQMKLQDHSHARYFELRNGRIRTRAAVHPNPDVTLFFKNSRVALNVLMPPQDYGEMVHAGKTFQMGVQGKDELVCWWMQTLNKMLGARWRFGVDLDDGEIRYVNNTNGGPVHVYVKGGKIVRITPIDFEEKDAPSWEIEARGRTFKPPRRASVTSYSLAWKSMIESKDRNLYPMKRVDFDPNGERNPQNRGISGYERISWDEALDIVASEFKRVKRDFGPGAIAVSHGSHHNWGNVGYYLSAMIRFFNGIGFTRVIHNPDSWEGWYWGGVHHYGYSMRLGNPEPFGQVEDCLNNAEMIVFWSSDPEATNGLYAGYEGTIRRLWAKELGIKMVHIDPHWNHSAAFYDGKWIAPRPGTDPALAQALCYVWIDEDLYDKEFVEKRTTGFDEWAAHIMGREDGTPKTPEWAEQETGVPAREIRALAREWGKKRTYLGAGGLGGGFGGACRTSTGAQWARMMIILMAMQGIGRPGVNFGNLQQGAPLDYTFWFPGYAEGGISGDLTFTGSALITYPRMPHVMSMNPVKQAIPRIQLPEAILEGEAEGYFTDPTSMTGQFLSFKYPAPGHSKIQILYKYGGASLGTMNNTNRWVKMYQSDKLPFVVSQSIWFEGETKFADVILPACTNFERWDIGEWTSAGGYGHQFYNQVNHRVVTLQAKCIEPLGESKSDYQIFSELAQRMGLGLYFTEGCSEIDWVKRVFEASDVSQMISWKEFLRKGYFVVPADAPKARAPTAFKWFNEGRKKDVPEPHPLPGDYGDEYLEGLQTQSGKIEFIPETLKNFDDPERPPLNRYMPSWEGTKSADLIEKYPIQLVSAHARYSFHTLGDGKNSVINDIHDHRVLVDGHYYWIARVNPRDAEARKIRDNDLIRLYNDRGSVICAARLTERIMPGVVHACESSAVYDPVGKPGQSADRGGCVNQLTNHRSQSRKSSSMAPNACLIEIERWQDPETESAEDVA
ncbi:MAG: molybdopterin-dependent oxidoreductase [Gammaproteobacteria bacterium]